MLQNILDWLCLYRKQSRYEAAFLVFVIAFFMIMTLAMFAGLDYRLVVLNMVIVLGCVGFELIAFSLRFGVWIPQIATAGLTFLTSFFNLFQQWPTNPALFLLSMITFTGLALDLFVE